MTARRKALLNDDPAYRAATASAARSVRDPRIRAIFAMAPALGFVMTPASLRSVSIPAHIFAVRHDQVVPPNSGAEIYAKYTKAKLTMLQGDEGHFVFLDLCTEAGKIAQPGPCQDKPGVNRARVHQQTAAQAADFFATALK